MEEWTPSPETAKIVASGAFGAMVLVYLRHPGTLVRAGFVVGIGVGSALIFADYTASLLGIEPVPIAAVLGLLGKGLAEGLLRGVDKFDFAEWAKRKIEP